MGGRVIGDRGIGGSGDRGIGGWWIWGFGDQGMGGRGDWGSVDRGIWRLGYLGIRGSGDCGIVGEEEEEENKSSLLLIHQDLFLKAINRMQMVSIPDHQLTARQFRLIFRDISHGISRIHNLDITVSQE